MSNPKAHKFWQNRYEMDPDLGSGVGSSGVWKRRKLDVLEEICRRHRVRRILDLGCGDLQVMGDFPYLQQCEYVGVDFSERVIQQNQERFPRLKFVQSDLLDIHSLDLEAADLVVCFDVLFHVQDDGTYDRLCEYIFNCGAKAVALTCSVGREDSNGVNLWYRDFWKHARRLQLGYVHKIERPFRLPFERILSFDLCEPSVHSEPTEVVYVCSGDREIQLFTSLTTLLNSGRSYDRIVIFCVGDIPKTWQFSDPRIIVKSVPPLFGDYFYGNKVYIGSRAAARLVFLDTDTVILRPLDLIWKDKDADFLARIGSAYDGFDWDSKMWKQTSYELGVGDIPMFNAGVLVFQNRAHRRIYTEWSKYITAYLNGTLKPPYTDSRMPEQWGLALAVGRSKLKYSLLTSREHAYGWRNEDVSECVVFHTGNQRFEEYTVKLGLDAVPSLPLEKEGTNSTVETPPLFQERFGALLKKIGDLEQEISYLRSSRTFCIGLVLAAGVRSLVSAILFDFREMRYNLKTVQQALQSLTKPNKKG